MGHFSQLPFQQAVYARLSGDATLAALVTGVYDHVPQAATFPYVVIGDMALSEWSTRAGNGLRYVLELHVASRGRGRKDANGIIERMAALLHDASLTVTGHTLVYLRCESSRIELEDDGLTFKGTLRLIAATQAA